MVSRSNPEDERAAAQRALAIHMDHVAREAQSAASMLGGLSSSLKSLSDQVTSVVGGSAQKVDADLLHAFDSSRRELDQSVGALGQVVTTARRQVGR